MGNIRNFNAEIIFGISFIDLDLDALIKDDILLV